MTAHFVRSLETSEYFHRICEGKGALGYVDGILEKITCLECGYVEELPTVHVVHSEGIDDLTREMMLADDDWDENDYSTYEGF